MEREVKRVIPVNFQKLEEFQTEDTRFIKVKIWLMHLGENLNGSYFDKEVVENAIPSLANTPILAYIEPNSNGEDDFSDHRSRLVRKKDGEWKYEYIGQAIGLIPETNNAKFEKRVAEDGIEREYLTCEGLVWTKWDKPVEIFDRDKVKSQSMELHDNFEGYWDEKDGLFHFTKFKFFGACALGFDVLPAMTGATIETNFSLEDLRKEIQIKMEEFKQYTASLQERRKKEVEEKLKLLEEFSITKEEVENMGINFEEIELEELRKKLEEHNAETVEVQEEKIEEAVEVQENKEEIEEKFIRTYELSHSDIKARLYLALKPLEDEYNTFYWIIEVYDNYFVYMDEMDGKYYRQSYTKTDSEVTLVDDRVEVFATYLTQEEINQLKAEKENFAKLQKEVEELREYKINKEAEERKEAEQEIFSKFEEKLIGDEEFEKLKENASQFSIEELEEKCYAILGKKAIQFSANKTKSKKPVTKFSVNEGGGEQKVSKPYDSLMAKYKN